MKAYISVREGKSEIKLIDDAGNTIDIFLVRDICVEVNRGDIEPIENQGILLPGYLSGFYHGGGRVQ
jgi:hypothetical protein